jgi:hypothetical protein
LGSFSPSLSTHTLHLDFSGGDKRKVCEVICSRAKLFQLCVLRFGLHQDRGVRVGIFP